MQDLLYDDGVPSTSTATELPDFDLASGESYVVIIEMDADNPKEFENSGVEFDTVWDFMGMGSLLTPLFLLP